MMSTDNKSWARRLLVLQVFLLAVLVIAPLGHKAELLPFAAAFLGALLAMALVLITGVLGFAMWLWAWAKKAPQLRLQAGCAAVIGVAPVLVAVVVVGPANFAVPPIHDISTDTENPPQYVAAKRERSPAENTLEYPGAEVARLQRQAYPEVGPLLSELPVEAAFERSLAVVEALGWRLLEQEPGSGRIEAVEETAWFGFKDDIIIRISAAGTGSRVDSRSVSRVGKSDLGANAARILRFQRAFEAGVE
ncbi:DUF1499 domain-containing protein [Exilibacterium tricleocarpae]|nr:DUF1499 domain-containing protein [Exilibacterium tricleocarpae]